MPSTGTQTKIEPKKNRPSTIHSRYMGTLKRLVKSRGVGHAQRPKNLKKRDGAGNIVEVKRVRELVDGSMSINSGAAHMFATVIEKFQRSAARIASQRAVAVKNDKQASSKKSAKKDISVKMITASDVDDAVKVWSLQLYKDLQKDVTEAFSEVVGKQTKNLLPLRRTADIMRQETQSGRIKREAAQRLNAYATVIALWIVKFAGTKTTKHYRMNEVDFMAVYNNDLHRLYSSIMINPPPKKSKSLSALANRSKPPKTGNVQTEGGEYLSDDSVSSISGDSIHSDSDDDIPDEM